MDTLEKIKTILIDILDIEEDQITPETYLIRDLGAESIDLLELAVSLNSAFKIKIIDDEIFLNKLRLYLNEAEEKKENSVLFIAKKYPFLSKDRITEILNDINKGPALKIKDLENYVLFKKMNL